MSLFGDELRRLRRASGLSQETLAARAGLSPEAISLLERGKRSPRMTTMRLLAEGMGLADDTRTAFFATANLDEPAVAPLPLYADSPLGRDEDLTLIAALIEGRQTRLLTLFGPAGIGKTRIAVAFAASRPARFSGGVHWLPVGPVTDASSLLGALAGALGVRGAHQATMEEIIEHVGDQPTLLVVDNAEQQLAACAEMCQAALAGAPELLIIMTSRHLTGVPGELALPVKPLELPPLETDAAGLMDSPAAKLFLARATFRAALLPGDAEAISRICHRLDGLPLALELAAARTSVLTVRELADSLDSELGILTAPGPHGAQGLADAMVSWSFTLLTGLEQDIFIRLCVFGAGFSREAVAAVCGDGLSEIEVVEVLSSLVAKSLVERRDDRSRQARFRLLQPIREYARERLARRSDRAATHRQHAEFYAGVVEQAARANGPDQHEQLAILDREASNIRRALTWSTLR